MRQETVTVYSYNELPSDKAKERARDWWREGGLSYEWWDAVYDDAARIFDILGITEHEISFSGFWSQGDGASFTGRYAYKAGSCKAIRAYAPTDNTLHSIADDLSEFQRTRFYGVEAKLTRGRSHYCHAYSVEFDVWDRHGTLAAEDEKAFAAIMRRLMDWIYKMLESEYEYLTSDEAVAETIEANDYEFTADGKIY